jgi:hypothetical protein
VSGIKTKQFSTDAIFSKYFCPAIDWIYRWKPTGAGPPVSSMQHSWACLWWMITLHVLEQCISQDDLGPIAWCLLEVLSCLWLVWKQSQEGFLKKTSPRPSASLFSPYPGFFISWSPAPFSAWLVLLTLLRWTKYTKDLHTRCLPYFSLR